MLECKAAGRGRKVGGVSEFQPDNRHHRSGVICSGEKRKEDARVDICCTRQFRLNPLDKFMASLVITTLLGFRQVITLNFMQLPYV